MFQFSWKLFLEMQKAKHEKGRFQSLFNYSEFSERWNDMEAKTGLIIRWPGFIFSSAKSCVNLGSAPNIPWDVGGGAVKMCLWSLSSTVL